MSPLALASPSAFHVLAAFVAINTAIYGSLAVVKMFPRFRLNSWIRRRYHRAETRSINPGIDHQTRWQPGRLQTVWLRITLR